MPHPHVPGAMSQTRSTLVAIAVLLLVFAGGTFVAFELLLGRDLPVLPSPGRVAVVPVEGVITSPERTLEAVRRFRESGSVDAFVIEIRSPGGSVGASQSLYREFRDLSRRDERPVLAWIGDVGASGGYYVALAADSIYALPGSITGSIGVIMEFPDARELMRKVGVGIEMVRSGEHKGAGSPFRELDEEDRRVFQTLVDDAYGQFVDAVVAGRGIGRDSVVQLADGRVFSGARAERLGLVDGISTLSGVVDRAGRMAGLGDDPRTVRPGQRKITILDVLDEGVSVATVRDWVRDWLGWTPPEAGTPRLLYRWR